MRGLLVRLADQMPQWLHFRSSGRSSATSRQRLVVNKEIGIIETKSETKSKTDYREFCEPIIIILNSEPNR